MFFQCNPRFDQTWSLNEFARYVRGELPFAAFFPFGIVGISLVPIWVQLGSSTFHLMSVYAGIRASLQCVCWCSWRSLPLYSSLLLRNFVVSTQFCKRLPVSHISVTPGICRTWHFLGAQSVFAQTVASLEAVCFSCVFLTRRPSYIKLGTLCLIYTFVASVAIVLLAGNTLVLNADVATAW